MIETLQNAYTYFSPHLWFSVKLSNKFRHLCLTQAKKFRSV
jgi:hypothetical protein